MAMLITDFTSIISHCSSNLTAPLSMKLILYSKPKQLEASSRFRDDVTLEETSRA